VADPDRKGGDYEGPGQIFPGRLVVPRAALDNLRERHGFTVLEPGDLVAGDDAKRRYPEGFVEFIGSLLADSVAIQFDDISSPSETLERIDAIQELLGIDVQPFFRFSLFNHFGFLDSIDPSPAESTEIECFDPHLECEGLPVYVVDTGFTTPDAWDDSRSFTEPDPRIGPLEPIDEDVATEVSHGTFVACVIGAISPFSRIRVLKVDLDVERVSEIRRVDAEEVAVVAALYRVMAQCGDEKAVLNVSFGAPPVTTPGGAAVVPPLLGPAMRQLAARKPNLIVLASGGNQPPHRGEDFAIPYPAAFDRVVSVGAADEDGDWVLWDRDGHPIEAEPYVGPWENHLDRLAPGVDLIAPAGRKVVKWSGSSFATAVQSGVLAREGTLIDADYDDYPFFG